MARNDRFEILTEVLIEGHCRVALISFAKDFSNGPSAAMLGTKNRDRPVILLNNDLYALLHFSQNGMKIASHFGFAHVYGCHCFYYGSCSPSSSCWTAVADRNLPLLRGRFFSH